MRRSGITVVFLLSLLVINVAAFQTRREVWPRLEVYIPLKPKVRLVITAGSEKASESGEHLEGDLGASVDYFWKKRWTLGTGQVCRRQRQSSKVNMLAQ